MSEGWVQEELGIGVKGKALRGTQGSPRRWGGPGQAQKSHRLLKSSLEGQVRYLLICPGSGVQAVLSCRGGAFPLAVAEVSPWKLDTPHMALHLRLT